MIPFVQVSHLPSSSSFFSAILQPLGLHCVSPSPDEIRSGSCGLQSSISYGTGPDNVVLHVRQSEHPLKPPNLSSLVLCSPSKQGVLRFHSSWLRADPPSWSLFRDERRLELKYGDRQQALQGPFRSTEGGVTTSRAIAYDHDGNRLEIIHYHDSPQNAPRVIDWQHKLDLRHNLEAKTANRESSFPRFSYKPNMAPRESHAPSSTGLTPQTRGKESRESEQEANPRQSSLTDGLNTTTVVGALLGVAAGAALTYGFVSGNSSPSMEEPHRAWPEQDDMKQREPKQRSGVLPRRATFPEKPVTHQHRPPRYGDIKRTSDMHSNVPRKLAEPDFRSHAPVNYTYGEGDNDVYYGVTHALPSAPSVTSQHYSKPPSTHVRASSRGRRRDDGTRTEVDNRNTTSHSSGRASTTRARSETARDRAPLTNRHSWERRSPIAPPKPPSVVSRPPLSRSHRSHVEPDKESYVSARSRRSRSTTRPADREQRSSRDEFIPRRQASSRISAVTAREHPQEIPVRASSQVSARRVPLPRSVVGSSHAHWDAREVPLPRSTVGSSHAQWNPWEVPLPRSGVGSSHANWDDDMVSLAPSDSISCVASRPRGRTSRH